MKILKKMMILIVITTLMTACLFACKVEPREDSEIYSCYYYAVDGEELTSEIVYYTLELRTDGVLITRYKTKKNRDSGRDKYYIEDGILIVSMDYSSKKYDMPGNEIIISEAVDNYYLLAKFRRTQTVKEIASDIYSCTQRVDSEGTAVDFRYYVASFEADGSFSLWFRDKNNKAVYSGTYIDFNWGYLATESAKDSEQSTKSWRFDFSGDGLILNETINGSTVTSTFSCTQSRD